MIYVWRSYWPQGNFSLAKVVEALLRNSSDYVMSQLFLLLLLAFSPTYSTFRNWIQTSFNSAFLEPIKERNCKIFYSTTHRTVFFLLRVSGCSLEGEGIHRLLSRSTPHTDRCTGTGNTLRAALGEMHALYYPGKKQTKRKKNSVRKVRQNPTRK